MVSKEIMEHINLEEGRILVEGKWLTEDEIRYAIKMKVESDDYNVAELAKALQTLINEMNKSTVLKVRVPKEVAEEFEKMSKEGNETVESILRGILIEYMNREEETIDDLDELEGPDELEELDEPDEPEEPTEPEEPEEEEDTDTYGDLDIGGPKGSLGAGILDEATETVTEVEVEAETEDEVDDTPDETEEEETDADVEDEDLEIEGIEDSLLDIEGAEEGPEPEDTEIAGDLEDEEVSQIVTVEKEAQEAESEEEIEKEEEIETKEEAEKEFSKKTEEGAEVEAGEEATEKTEEETEEEAEEETKKEDTKGKRSLKKRMGLRRLRMKHKTS